MTDYIVDEIDRMFLLAVENEYDSYEYGQFHGFIYALKCAKILNYDQSKFLHNAATYARN